MVRSRSTQESQILTADQMLDRLPARPIDGIRRWPFADAPLLKDTDFVGKHNISHAPAAQLLKISGIITGPSLENEATHIMMQLGNRVDDQWAELKVPNALAFRQLTGLALQAVVFMESPSSYVPIVELREVHGIQTPLKPGDRTGLIRGEVGELRYGALNDVPIGMQITVEDGIALDIEWANEITADDLAANGLLETGALVTMHANLMSDPLEFLGHIGSYKYLHQGSSYLLEAAPVERSQ